MVYTHILDQNLYMFVCATELQDTELKLDWYNKKIVSSRPIQEWIVSVQSIFYNILLWVFYIMDKKSSF